MKRFLCIKLVLAGTMFSLLTGCGEKKIDASSEEKLKSSIENIKKSLSDEKKKEFEKATVILAFSGLGDAWKTAKSPDEAQRIMRSKFHGKTADEIIAEAKPIIAQREKEIKASETKNELKENDPLMEETRLSKEKEKLAPKGAFGFKFGDIYTPPEVLSEYNCKKLTNGELVYCVGPFKKFRKFGDVMLLITPNTHKVYAIWSHAKFNSSSDAIAEYNIVSGLLEKKYKTKPGFRMNIQGKACGISFDASNIDLLVYTLNSSVVELRYTDKKLAELAKKEKLEIEARKSDSSAI